MRSTPEVSKGCVENYLIKNSKNKKLYHNPSIQFSHYVRKSLRANGEGHIQILLVLITVIMKIILRIILLSFLISLTALMGALIYVLNHQWADFSVLEHYDPGKPSILLDDEGREWARFQLDRREPIALEVMPQHVIDAFIAAEDWQFFSHSGLSFKGIFRSIFVNLYHGRKVQGASTITQQLVKLLFLDSSKTFSRKIKEQLYALVIERQFTKEQILQTYLNHVYFGCGIYGVQAAAQRFWGINASDLSVDQSATLAAIIRNPAQYCPLLCPLSAQKRRNVILHSMHKLGLIDKTALDAAVLVPMNVIQENKMVIAPHAKEAIRQFLEDLVGREKLYSGGLVIQTTLNQKAQLEAQEAFKNQCAALKKTMVPNIDGGFISMAVSTGEIKALVGGFDYEKSKFNRAFQSRRQLGSIFKPLLYIAALEQGYCFADTEIDEPIDVIMHKNQASGWQPNNYNMKFEGQMTLAYALSHSNNIVAIKLLLKVGIERVIELAKRFHITAPMQPYPSLALGCVDVTLKEACGLMNVFANNGVYVEPHLIKWVADQWGNKVYKHTAVRERVLSTRTNDQIAKVLQLGLLRVHKWFPDRWIDCQAISKTGTTDDSRTCWFVGSTPELTTGIWMGCDNNDSLGKNVFPVRTAFPIWLDYNRAVTSKRKEFVFDTSLHEVVIDEMSGYVVKEGDEGAIKIFL